MQARYPGTCAATGRRINPGDEIRRTRTGYVLTTAAPDTGRYVSDVFNIGGREFYRNKRGRCEDAPCCGCCTI